MVRTNVSWTALGRGAPPAPDTETTPSRPLATWKRKYDTPMALTVTGTATPLTSEWFNGATYDPWVRGYTSRQFQLGCVYCGATPSTKSSVNTAVAQSRK